MITSLTKNKMRIALIYGGSSPERNVSIDSGKRIYTYIDKSKYDVFTYDPVKDLLKLVSDANKIDFAFVALHGSCGEDGAVQGVLNLLGIPYQGSGILGSAVAMNKIVSKRLFEQAGLPIIPYVVLSIKDLKYNKFISLVESKLKFPVIVKPAETGSSFGISIAKQANDLFTSLSNALKYDDFVLVESYIKGIELTCGVLGNNKLRALPLIEIIYNSNFFDHNAKYHCDLVQEICPARVSNNLTKRAQLYAKKAHDILFCRGYSRTDMILRDDEIFILETNTIPGMTSGSLYPKSAIHDGISFKDLIEVLISLGLENEHRRN